MKILIASDAWHPQVNGVVRSLSTTVDELRRLGHEVDVVEPSLFWTVPCPTYPEIRLSLACARKTSVSTNDTYCLTGDPRPPFRVGGYANV